MQGSGRTRTWGARRGAARRYIATVTAGALGALVVVAALLAGPVRPAHAQDSGGGVTSKPDLTPSWRPRPVRNGTVSLGGGATFGTLLGPELGQEFANGLGLGFSLRYRTAYDQAYGLSFEAHNFSVVTSSVADTAHSKLQVIVTTLDYYAYGATRTRMPHYLVLGVGLAQTRINDNDGEKEYPGDGGVFKVGGGVEYWQSRNMTVDFSVRYHGVFLRQKLDHDLQAALALNFYTSP